MPININQDNILKRKERHVRTELWKQRIYHIPFNPYKFPKNDGSGDFIPLPRRFSEIIAEFRKYIDEQKAQEKTEEERQQAKQKIKEIYSKIKEIIQQEIDLLNNSQITDQSRTEKIEGLEQAISQLEKNISGNQEYTNYLISQLEAATNNLNSLKAKLSARTINVPDWTKWKDINREFTKELVQEWIKYGFTYNQAFDWVNTGLSVQDAEYAAWLDKVAEIDCEKYLNEVDAKTEKDLKEQFEEYKKSHPSEPTSEQSWKNIRRLEAKILGLFKAKGKLQQEKESLVKKLEELKKTLTELNKSPSELARDKVERIKQLELGLKQNTANQFKRFNKECLEDNQEVSELLDEWKEQRKIAIDKKNACFIEEDNADSLVFCYQPPKGDFHALDDFLWYRNNIWYETIKGGWRRINHENAVVVIKRSFFIHNYHNFFLKGANGIFHNYPKFVGRQEICMCPSFLESTLWVDFACDWRPTYKLFQLENEIDALYTSDGRIPYIGTIKLKKLKSVNDFNTGLKEALLFLLPEEYDDKRALWMKPNIDLSFSSLSAKKTLVEWAEQKEIMPGMKNEHLAKHCSVQFFWNSKLIYTTILNNLRLNHMQVDIKANPSGIMYKFQSGSIFFRWSEDVKFNIDKNTVKEVALDTASSAIQGGISSAAQGAASGGATAGIEGAIAGGIAGLVGGLFNMAKGQKKNIETMTLNSLHNQVETKESKSKDEGQTERKTKYTGTADIVNAAMGSIPSVLSPSHTNNDYTLIEFILRHNDIPFQIRINYNENLFERYSMNKVLKKNGNEVFNTDKIGNLLCKGYIKAVANVFEGDRDGYFANLLARGVYFYEQDPSEYFEEKVARQKHEAISLLQTTTMTMTTIVENFSTAIGRDDLVHVDDMSWVWKDSYCRPISGGADLFPQLINQGRHKLKRDDANAWKFDGYANWQGEIDIPKDTQYEWFMHAFSSGQKDSRKFKGLDDGNKVILKQAGAEWSLSFIGKFEITETVGNPDAIGSGLPGTEIDDEQLPDMENEKQTAGLESMEQNMQAEAEQQNQEELLGKLQRQEEKTDEQTKEKQDELEPEPDKNKEKSRWDEKPKEDEQAKEDEDDDVARSSREK